MEISEAYFNQRGGLDVAEWAIDKGFGMPVGITGFRSEWSEYCDEVHRHLNWMPPVEYRSPRQHEEFERAEAERLKELAIIEERERKIEVILKILTTL